MLVSVNDFNLDINIPNTDESPVANRLTGYIAKYEPIYMEQLLGESLYAEFKAGLEIDPVPAKWTALKNAITVEQIATFVYWYWVRKNNSYLSGLNTIVKPKAENAASVSPVGDMVFNWNQMVDASYKTVKFIQENNADYNNYYLPGVLHLHYHGYCNQYCLPDIFHKQNTLGI